MTWIWAPKNSFDGRRPDLDRCRESVRPKDGGGWSHSQQCTRKAIVFRCVENHEGEFGFCRQHDPEAVKARNKARQDKWKAEWAAERTEHERDLLTREAQAAAKSALELIAAGHNDPRSLAAETLSLFPA